MHNYEFGCKCYELFHFSCIKLIFHVIFEELLNAAMWLKLLRVEGQVPKKIYFTHKILDFYLSLIKKITLDST